VLSGPPEPNDHEWRPVVPRECSDPRNEVPVVGELFGGGPNGRPQDDGIQDAPERQMSSNNHTHWHWSLQGPVEDPAREERSEHRRRKDDEEVAQACQQNLSMHGPDQVTYAQIFSSSQYNKSCKTAEIGNGPPDGPPCARCRPRRRNSPKPVRSSEKALANKQKEGSAWQKRKRRCQGKCARRPTLLYAFWRV
jgi:hypothetical protein